MVPTLKDGRYYYFAQARSQNVNRFDIIAFKFDNKIIIKRVIGLPDEVLTFQKNKTMIQTQDEDIIINLETFGMEMIPTTILSDSFFVISDNLQTAGYDSRKLGPIMKESLLYKIKFGIWPIQFRFPNPYA